MRKGRGVGDLTSAVLMWFAKTATWPSVWTTFKCSSFICASDDAPDFRTSKIFFKPAAHIAMMATLNKLNRMTRITEKLNIAVDAEP